MIGLERKLQKGDYILHHKEMQVMEVVATQPFHYIVRVLDTNEVLSVPIAELEAVSRMLIDEEIKDWVKGYYWLAQEEKEYVKNRENDH